MELAVAEREVGARRILGFVGRGHTAILRDFDSEWVAVKPMAPNGTNVIWQKASKYSRLRVEAPGIEAGAHSLTNAYERREHARRSIAGF